MINITSVSDHKSALGEGPLWDPALNALYWVDSLGPTLYRLDHASGRVRTWRFPTKTIGSLAVRERGGLILAMDHGFYSFCLETERLELIAEPLAGRAGIRFNDGKVDRNGAFIAGAMNINQDDHDNCPAFRLNPDHSLEEILDGFNVFNGPCFNGAGDKLYLTGRVDGVIEVFDYPASGSLPAAEHFYAKAIPDGATVDAEDHIWSAQWTEGCLLRLTPEGEEAARIELPDQIVTSLMFGGPALDLIYVTTLGAPLRGVTPASASAGQTFVIEGVGVKGRAEPSFKG
ncbi:SMP-30/gluconolactonase/LRE family protein [Pelagibius sp. Alg239-R121]|uniref:SMP-30/gluconolactonase/LRE family protein n=1 Tax=Pelagibius sp. Alg239-R121 TaxID=2993448 RepID=UPI0024A71322|nr:SMP-30/gluconolactonase/LRE family protein [Pelagibius sp. Alg239-R121]